MATDSAFSGTRRARFLLAIPVLALALSGCAAATATPVPPTTAATPNTVTSAPTVADTTSAAPSELPPTAPSALATGVPTALDPCQLVTSQEASQLAGASYGAGVESTTSGGGKICTYGSQTLNVFSVIVGQAPDAATAQAAKAEAEAAIQQQAGNAVQFTELPNFADGAAYVVGNFTISGQSFGAGAIYVLKGTVFFGFSDLALNKPALTLAALEAQAQVILGRLP